MERLQELLNQLSQIEDLSDEQLQQLLSDLQAVYSEIREGEDVASQMDNLARIVEATTQIRERLVQREQQRQELERQLGEMDATVLGEQTGDATTVTAPEGEPAPAPAAPAATAEPAVEAEAVEPEPVTQGEPALVADGAPAEPEDAVEPEPVEPEGGTTTPAPVVAASLPAPGAITPPATHQRRAAVTTPRVQPFAYIDVAGADPATPLTDRQIHEALAARLNGLGRVSGGYTENVPVVRMVDSEWGPGRSDRWLGRDPNANHQVLETHIGRRALTAAGGVCAPRVPDYTIDQVGVTDRPIWSGLPHFPSDRGGVTIFLPEGYRKVGTPLFGPGGAGNPGSPNQAVSHLTIEQDAEGFTKPYQEFDCREEVPYDIEAWPLVTRHGVMNQRFFPELIADDLHNAEVAYARYTEMAILAKIDANLKAVTKTQVLGAARDILEAIQRAVARARQANRLGQLAYTAILPSWVVDVFQRDLRKQLPSGLDSWTITEAWVRARFQELGVTPLWSLDGLADEMYGLQTAGAVLGGDPTILRIRLFPTGAFGVLDGGEMNLGIVRDDTLIRANKYGLFQEEFWNIMFRGLADTAVRITQTFCINGGAAGTINPDNICDGGS